MHPAIRVQPRGRARQFTPAIGPGLSRLERPKHRHCLGAPVPGHEGRIAAETALALTSRPTGASPQSETFPLRA